MFGFTVTLPGERQPAWRRALLVLGLSLLLAPALTGQDPRIVKALHGITPGESKLEAVQGEPWSRMLRQATASDGTEQRYFVLAPWEQVIILSRGQTIVAIDLVPPLQFTVGEIAQALRLGQLDVVLEPPPQAACALEEWSGPLLESTQTRVLVKTQLQDGKTLVARIRFFGNEALTSPPPRKGSLKAALGPVRQTIDFRGVTPGRTTVDQLLSLPEWGPPLRKISADDAFDLYRYLRTEPSPGEAALIKVETVLEAKQQQGTLDRYGQLTLLGSRGARGRHGAELWSYEFPPWSQVSLLVQDNRVWAIDLFPAAAYTPAAVEKMFGIEGLLPPGQLADTEPPLVKLGAPVPFDPGNRSPEVWPLGYRRLQIPQGLRVGPVLIPDRLRYVEYQQHRVALLLKQLPNPTVAARAKPSEQPALSTAELVHVIRLFADVPERYVTLGVSIRNREGAAAGVAAPARQRSRLVEVERVVEGYPAATCGLQPGDLLLRLNEREVQSVEHFRQLVALSPYSVPSELEILRDQQPLTLHFLPIPQALASAFARRAAFYSAADQLKAALVDVELAIELEEPVTASSLALRGDLRRRLGLWDLAISDLSQALVLTPGLLTALSARGLCYDQLGRFDEAIVDYTTILQIAPASPQTLVNRGASLFRKGDLSAALADTNQAIELDPQHAMAHFNRGIIRERQGDSDAALADYSRAIQLAPDDIRPLAHRAALYRQRNAPELAAADEAQVQRLKARLKAPRPPIPGPGDN
jgi:tetratricopeptide (TPR) repeat protein